MPQSTMGKEESSSGIHVDQEIHDMRLDLTELQSHVVHIRTDIARSSASSHKATVVTGVLVALSVVLAVATIDRALPSSKSQAAPSDNSNSHADAKSMADLRSEIGQLRTEVRNVASQLAFASETQAKAEIVAKQQARLDCSKLPTDVKADIVDFSIRFDVGSNKIPADSEGTLNSIAKLLALSPDLCVLIEGYTDETGDAEKNMGLSLGRAGSVASYLAQKPGIKRDRLVTIGKGSSSSVPGVAPSNPLNRRVVFKVVSSSE